MLVSAKCVKWKKAGYASLYSMIYACKETGNTKGDTQHMHTTHIFSGRIYKNLGGNDCL